MYVKALNNTVDTYPYNMQQLKEDNPRVSFPKTIPASLLADYDVYSVTEEAKPSYNERTQTVAQNTQPTLVEGVWKLQWTVTDKSSDDVASYDADFASQKRNERDARLADTDWWGASDNTMTQAQTDYRQALRDITTHANWPNLVDADWPTKP